MANEWSDLNDTLRDVEDEKALLKMLREELSGRNRPIYVERIYGRFSRARSIRERGELKVLKAPRG
jgi:hypothetical protein